MSCTPIATARNSAFSQSSLIGFFILPTAIVAMGNFANIHVFTPLPRGHAIPYKGFGLSTPEGMGVASTKLDRNTLVDPRGSTRRNKPSSLHSAAFIYIWLASRLHGGSNTSMFFCHPYMHAAQRDATNAWCFCVLGGFAFFSVRTPPLATIVENGEILNSCEPTVCILRSCAQGYL